MKCGFDSENTICNHFIRHFGLKSTPAFRQTPHALQAVLAGLADVPAVYKDVGVNKAEFH